MISLIGEGFHGLIVAVIFMTFGNEESDFDFEYRYKLYF